MKRYAMQLSILSIIALFLLIYIIPLGERPVVIPDETRYAEISREMLITGDWIVPHFNGLRYFEKPALGYWPVAVSIGLFGESAFSIRLPSALASLISALIIFLILKRSGKGYQEGFLSAIAFLTCVEVFAVGTTNILDSVFTMFITATMAGFFFAYKAENAGSRRMWQALGGVFAGLAFLTKGFIAFAIPAIVIIPFLLWNRRGRELAGSYWISLAAAGLVLLPWGVAIYFREPDFWHYFFWTEHINRFMGSKPQHAEPFWFFFPTIVWGAFPWIILLPAAIYGLVRNRIREPLLRFAVCWFLCPFLLFSISRGKLVTYILPCYPPLIIILILGLFEYFASGWKKMFNNCLLILIGVFLLLAVGLVVVQTGVFPVPRVFNRLETWKWIIMVAGILFWSFFLFLAARQKEFLRKIIFFCAGPVLLLFSSNFLFPHLAEHGKAPGDFFRLHALEIEPDTIIVSDDSCAGSVCWFLDRNDVFLIGSIGEFEYGLDYPDARWRRINFKLFKKGIEIASRRKRILLILNADQYLEYQPNLPRPISVKTSDGFVLAEF